MDITLTFIDPDTGQMLEIPVTWSETSAAIAYYEQGGWELVEGGRAE